MKSSYSKRKKERKERDENWGWRRHFPCSYFKKVIFSYSCRNKTDIYLFQHHLNGSPGFCSWCWTIFWQRPWTMRAGRERKEESSVGNPRSSAQQSLTKKTNSTSNLAFLPTPIFHCFRMSSCNWLRHLIEHQEEANSPLPRTVSWILPRTGWRSRDFWWKIKTR